MARVLGSPPPTWETQEEILALAVAGIWRVNQPTGALSLCLSSKYRILQGGEKERQLWNEDVCPRLHSRTKKFPSKEPLLWEPQHWLARTGPARRVAVALCSSPRKRTRS